MTERDIEAPEADAAEQQVPVVEPENEDAQAAAARHESDEANEADVVEQEQSAGRDDEDEYR